MCKAANAVRNLNGTKLGTRLITVAHAKAGAKPNVAEPAKSNGTGSDDISVVRSYQLDISFD